MRFRRTPCLSKKQLEELEEQIRLHPEKETELRKKDPRATYKVFDDEGHVVAIFNPETDTTMDVTIDVKRRITKLMHTKVDDVEVRENNKERKLDPFSQMQYDQTVDSFRKKFRDKYGRDPRKEELPEGSHRSHVSLEAPVDAAGGATIGEILPDETANFFEEEETPISCMEELMASELFSDRERTIYDCKIRKQMTNEQMGEVIGTSGQYAGRIWNGIVEKIRNNAEIKRFFRV
ncbi:hypothetical protein D6855_16025 [Butyrivibrio sp. CB08]|uniref:hypothetical protein n=1 Tax=Butyrivibrio sp. CB08 TaxID=2364879 RepID=UPI000EA9AFD7|nr:hypothetical protein [Butyrivibrio sp. CB08]RKM55440.1 hypothetical protein D6855_16025 [Butyrivibrio sp. CB08]